MPCAQQVTKPFDRSYWVEPGRFLAGFYPGGLSEQEAKQKLDALLDIGITCIVNLMEEDELDHNGQLFRPYTPLLMALAAARRIEVTYVRMPVRDQGIPTIATMQMILDTIDSAMKRKQATYVHCWGGLGRTGTVVGCYLARHGIASGDEALNRIVHLRRNHDAAFLRPSPETPRQRDMVCQWQQGQ
jgi:hypothetical protein